MIRIVLVVLATCFLITEAFSQTITTGVINPTTYCAGVAINVPFTSVGVYTAGNVYTAELSGPAGAFPGTSLGTLTSTANTGTIAGTVPFTAVTGTGYRVRVSSTSPASTMIVNVSNITVNPLGINAPTFAGVTFCPGSAFNITYTLNSNCNFPNTPANVFTAELSDAFGNFAAPQSIGSRAAVNGGTIAVIIPVTASAGTGYRIRVRSNNPGTGIIGPNNGVDLTVNAIGVNTVSTGATTFCAGATFNVSYTLASACTFFAGNAFTAELSDASGVFAATPPTIGTVNATGAGNVSVTLPQTTPAGTGYRIRIVSSNPVRTSLPNTSNLTVNQFGINAPTVTGTSFCQGSAVAVAYTIQNTCTFPNTPTANIFTAQLSNAAGSFASPTNIGTITSNNAGTINAVIPVATPAGAGYRIRVVSLNPSAAPVTGADNGANLTVTASSGTPTVFGSGLWNAYVYSGTNATITNNVFLGAYTENNLTFNSTTRWASASGPGVADASSGTAYSGCAAPATNYSISYKRTGFSCGYYQIDIPSHDDDVRMYLNGTLVFSHAPGCCDAHTNAFTTFLNASSQLDVQVINFGGPGSLAVTIAIAPNPLTVSPGVTICSGSSTTITATGPPGVSFAWAPTTGLTPSNGLGATVTAAPTTTTTYTVFATDAVTSCQVTRAMVIGVVAPATVPTVTVANTTPTICSGITATTLTASGASTYTWSPAAGLSSTTGNSVIANPASTTTYTVTGSTGCQSNTATTTVTVQVIPSTPTPTTFGSGQWNIFSHNNMTLSNYYGFYSENNLSFNTATRWGTGAGPSAANGTTGAAYTGCTVSATNNSMSFKRTNFTCGYYQMNLNYHDDGLTMLVDGAQVFQNNGFTATVQTNVWSGFLNASSTVELRLINTGGAGRLDINFGIVSGPQVLSPNVVICPNTFTDLTATATAYPNATYTWAISPVEPTITFTPGTTVANTRLQTTSATPSTIYTLTSTITDAGVTGTGCTATRTLTVTVNALANTAITPASATIVCPTQTVTLTATGANTYTWAPASGLSATTGNVVIAQPATTTTYTVTGDNNCSTKDATVTVTVIPLPDYNIFPAGVWNIYGFNSQTIGTNYQGFYTDNGTGTPPWSFNSGTRWSLTQPPSVATATNGAAWQGCTMPTTNYSLTAKRRGFTCGVYQIDMPSHDDFYLLFVNGVQVSQHTTGSSDVHTAAWTGVLNPQSTVEIQYIQGTGNAFFGITFSNIVQPAGTSIWTGATSNDWFTASNWCNAVPTTTIDALIPALGPQNMPSITTTGAVARNITINAGVAAGTFNPALPAASLTMGTFNLDVNGNWTSNGTLNANAGTVSFVGANSGNTIGGSTTFNNVVVSKTNGITISGGATQQVGGTMTFTNGVVTSNGTLRYLAGGSVAGVSNASYVDGVVTKVGNTAFTFPVGKGGLYRPIGISAPSAVGDTYTVQYFNTTALGSYPNANRAASLDHVSNAEYWMLNRTAGTSAITTTLSWDTNSGGVSNLPTMRVAGWNGSFWADLGNAATSGNTTQGTVTGTTATTFSGPYTLSSTSFINALPVQLSDMQCGVNSFGYPEIKWVTEVEINSDYFQIERSVDGERFQSIAHISSKGDSRSTQVYSFEDENAPDGKIYYRLKQVDRDGRSETFEVCAMQVVSAGLSISPNPATGTATIKLHGDDLRELSVINSIGQTVNVNFAIKNSVIEMDVSTLAPGVYLIRVSTADKSGVLKLVKS